MYARNIGQFALDSGYDDGIGDGYSAAYSVDDDYDTAGAIPLETKLGFYGGMKMGHLYLYLESATGNPSELEYKLAMDPFGDWVIATNEGDPATIIPGQFDPGNCSAVVPIEQILSRLRSKSELRPDTALSITTVGTTGTLTVYLFVKMDTGDATLESAFVSYETFI